MPLLILLTAGSVLLVSDGMVRRSAREQADLVFAAASARAAQRAHEVFSHAGPALDGLRGW
ncbi:MAG: hypothetical protein J0M02_13765, partial [Planctomycetes bacterium]|nr:hypothetical protein [Planctomycetota bacterium]